mgnify:FL=1
MVIREGGLMCMTSPTRATLVLVEIDGGNHCLIVINASYCFVSGSSLGLITDLKLLV